MNSYETFGEIYYESRKKKNGISYFYNENLEMPATLKLLGNVKGKKILDVGCGPGIYARILTEAGASVKGIDFSKKFISIAKNEAPKALFTLGDAEKLPYQNKEFDIVLSTLMLGHFENWDNIFSEIKRVLKNNCIFIFSIKNPITSSMQKRKWFFRSFREVVDYFNEKWVSNKWRRENRGNTITSYVSEHHKTYSTIIKTIIKNSFEIIDYEDARPLLKAKNLFPKEYKRTINMPHFCIWKLRKK